MGGRSSPPPPPQMSAEEKALLGKQTEILNQMQAILNSQIGASTEQQDLLKRISGLYDYVDTTDGKKLVLNQDAVDRQKEISKMQLDRYEKALAGTLPVSEGTMQRKKEEFALLRENAARRGINIEGTSLDDATSDSTAGAALLGQFKRSYGLIEDAERRGELAGGVNSGLSLMGASSAAGPAQFLGASNGLIGAAGAIAQPYANQRMLEYQAGINAANYRNQGRIGAGQIIGGVIGAGAGALSGTGPMGVGVGYQIGAGVGGGMAGIGA